MTTGAGGFTIAGGDDFLHPGFGGRGLTCFATPRPALTGLRAAPIAGHYCPAPGAGCAGAGCAG
ncbi:hypothetical protein, partial [Nocardia gamkensis]|uniref:hypothetical protein n=1 Tax=Nocardia gamkensis TaxID=352869 RepID=UPI001C3FCFB1